MYLHFFSFKAVIGSDFSRGDEDWATFEDGKNVPLKHDYAQGIIAVQSAPDYTTTPTGAYFSAPGIHFILQITQTMLTRVQCATAKRGKCLEDRYCLTCGFMVTKVVIWAFSRT